VGSGDGRAAKASAVQANAADEWLLAVAKGASEDAGGIPVELLGDYLPMLADAAVTGRRPRARELRAVEVLGRRAAEMGISSGRAVDLYLSAAWRLWRELPAVARSRDSEVVRAAAEAVLHVVDDAVATLADGYVAARRNMVRREEAMRAELVDDLLRGDADVGSLVERAEPFGLDLARSHQVALAAPDTRLPDSQAATSALERVVLDRLGERDVIVAMRDGMLVVLAPADEALSGTSRPGAASRRGGAPSDDVGALIFSHLEKLPRGGPWRVTVGRPYPGASGIARSYEEAREALTMAARLQLDARLIRGEDLLVYRVLLRDQPAIRDLIQSVLTPLKDARGGAEPLLETLDAYFAVGEVAAEAARRLHLSVRAVTYRLDRIAQLTGYDPNDPAHRFTLHAAVLGAKMLGWPAGDVRVEEVTQARVTPRRR
jgi:sugar diacid utilization regulator